MSHAINSHVLTNPYPYIDKAVYVLLIQNFQFYLYTIEDHDKTINSTILEHAYKGKMALNGKRTNDYAPLVDSTHTYAQ